MKIKFKLLLLVSIFVIGLILTGGLSIFQKEASETANKELQEDFEAQLILKTLQYRFTGISNDERLFLLTGDSDLVDGIKEKAADIEGYFSTLEKMPNLSGSEKEDIQNIKENIATYSEAYNRMIDAYNNGEQEEALYIHMEEERNIRKELVDPSINEFIDEFTNHIEKEKESLAHKSKLESIFFYSAVVIIIIAGILLASFITRSIHKPIKIMTARLQEISDGEGDLTQTIDLHSKDELGEMANSFNKMIEKLRELVIQVSHNAEHVASASEQLTASTEDSKSAVLEEIKHDWRGVEST